MSVCLAPPALKSETDILSPALRLHPVIPINQRWANKNTLLPRGGGIGEEHPVAIPFGCNVYMNVYAMHRRSDIYGEDAEEFKPQRWNDLQPGWAYTPFGGGPRLCIGRKCPMNPEQNVCMSEADADRVK